MTASTAAAARASCQPRRSAARPVATRSARQAHPVGVTIPRARPEAGTPLIMRRSGIDPCHAGAMPRRRARPRSVRGGLLHWRDFGFCDVGGAVCSISVTLCWGY